MPKPGWTRAWPPISAIALSTAKVGRDNKLLEYPAQPRLAAQHRTRGFSQLRLPRRAGPRPDFSDRPGDAQVRPSRQSVGLCLRPRQQDRRHDRGTPGRGRVSRFHARSSITNTNTASCAWPTFSANWKPIPAALGRTSFSIGSTAPACADWSVQSVTLDNQTAFSLAALLRPSVQPPTRRPEQASASQGRRNTEAAGRHERADGPGLPPGRRHRLSGAHSDHARRAASWNLKNLRPKWNAL